MTENIICGDALEVLRLLPNECVQMCVTSPPYYGLRDYGVDGQVGVEGSPQEYVMRLVSIFHEVKRVMREDGTLWLNIADSYAGSGRGMSNTPPPEWKKCKNSYRIYGDTALKTMPNVWDGIKPKDMIGIPWMLAFALRADGWYLRSDIIWNKTNCLPESITARPTKSYEHIFLLPKSAKYYYDADAIKEPLAEGSIERYKRGRSEHTKYSDFGTHQKINEERKATGETDRKYRNKRDVWSVSKNSYRTNGHFAMYPERLVEPCILAGSCVGGVILDPFFGSGTTGAVAKRLGRGYVGIDLNPDYCALAQSRIEKAEVTKSGNKD